eukprot:2390649-Rhodomonas_salina.1
MSPAAAPASSGQRGSLDVFHHLVRPSDCDFIESAVTVELTVWSQAVNLKATSRESLHGPEVRRACKFQKETTLAFTNLKLG